MGSLDQIIYISIPEDMHHHIGDFHVDPSILLPVETTGENDAWEPDELTWAMIIAGMLKVLAYDTDHEDADYFRRFVLAARPEIVKEFSETGIINARNGDLDVAEEIFTALRGLAPAAIHPRVNLALVYEQRGESFEKVGNDEQARRYRALTETLYHELLSEEEPPPEVHLNAGLYFLNQRAYDRARTELSAYIDEGDDDEKVERARKLVAEIDGQHLDDDLFHSAFTLIRDGSEREGIEKVETFLGDHPDAWNGWFLLGWGHRRLEEYAEAYDAFQKAIEYGGDNGDTLNELAICAMELGSYDESRRSLEAALRVAPDDTRIISNLGVLALKQGRSDEARQFFSTVLELEPDDPIATAFFKADN